MEGRQGKELEDTNAKKSGEKKGTCVRQQIVEVTSTPEVLLGCRAELMNLGRII